MKSVNIDEKGWLYGRWEVMENTWEIQDRHAVGAYLLIGEEKAMLIDTMYGDGDLRAFIEEITDRPVMVSEDAGLYMEEVPGVYFWIGSGDPAHALHNPCMLPDLRVLTLGAEVHATNAIRLLEKLNREA